ncbi:cellulose synthase subunit BcsC-related outer membrane protein [Pseudidiomarina aestuarii]|uniref:cellulose synthase subunit BcsC-related outer membrane protein n=1 Tax=Pseudidiomarina aestuarii TaxID=624146 RepID=UPI003A978C86
MTKWWQLSVCLLCVSGYPIAQSQNIESTSTPWSATESDPAKRQSLRLVEERVQLWLQRGRTFQLEGALEQLERVLPRHPLVLELRANAALQAGDRAAAQALLAEMQRYAPNRIETIRLKQSLELTDEQLQVLAEIRLLDIAGRSNEAAQRLPEVYAKVPVAADLALEYWQIIARAGERERALKGMTELQQRYPEHIPTTLAILNQKLALSLLTTPDLQQLTGLTLDSIYGNAALSLWLRVLPTLTPSQSELQAVQQLARYFPNHAEVQRFQRDLTQQRRQLIAEQSKQQEVADQAEQQRDARDIASDQRTEEPTTESEIIAATEPTPISAPPEPELPSAWDVADTARPLEEAGRVEAARELYLQQLNVNPDSDSYFAYALFLERIGEFAEAQAQLDQLPGSESGEGVIALQQRLLDRRLAAVQNTRTQSVGGDFVNIPTTRLEDLSDRREAVLWLGYERAERESTPGISTLNTDSFIVRLTVPMEDNPTGEWFIQVDPIRANAGAADLDDNFWRNRFGTGLICESGCPSGIQPEAKEQGVAFGVGARWDAWEFDVGTSPWGFHDYAWVGGLSYSGDVGEFGWGVEAQRRILTSGLVNFSGITDPFSGEDWGPVTRNNLGFSMNWDQGTGWGWWANAGLNWFHGDATKSNRQWYAYSGLYTTVYDTEPFAVDLGLTGLSWGFANDQSQTTFGQGGYYSPKHYVSLSIPITLYGRYERLSYRFRASFGQSSTRLADSDFFPNNPGLQAQAEALAPITGIEPTFAGGKGGGFGRSYQATLEYQVNSHWYVGFSTTLERSEFFTPDNFMLYLRYHFGGWSLPARRPPAPPQRYVDNPWFE